MSLPKVAGWPDFVHQPVCTILSPAFHISIYIVCIPDGCVFADVNGHAYGMSSGLVQGP